MINDLTQDLACSNSDAEQLEYRRLEKSLKANLKPFGVWNTVNLLADVLDSYSAQTTEHYSEAESDYHFAAEILRAASIGMDLKYGDRSSERERKKALDRLLTAMTGVRP